MAKLKDKQPCQECGNDFIGWTGRISRFCSQACYHAGDRRRAIKRFWEKVKKTSTCWLWTGRTDKDGYGLSGIGRAHRVSFEIVNGPLPKGKNPLHRCHNPPCVNPDHLYAGTHADNMNDRQNMGHYDRGEKHPMAIITEDVVREIRSVYIPRKNGGLKVIATQYSVAPTTVHAIVTRKIWKHI